MSFNYRVLIVREHTAKKKGEISNSVLCDLRIEFLGFSKHSKDECVLLSTELTDNL